MSSADENEGEFDQQNKRTRDWQQNDDKNQENNDLKTSFKKETQIHNASSPDNPGSPNSAHLQKGGEEEKFAEISEAGGERGPINDIEMDEEDWPNSDNDDNAFDKKQNLAESSESTNENAADEEEEDSAPTLPAHQPRPQPSQPSMMRFRAFLQKELEKDTLDNDDEDDEDAVVGVAAGGDAMKTVGKRGGGKGGGYHNEQRLIQLYREYKERFAREQLTNYFNLHAKETWFLEKYHPDHAVSATSYVTVGKTAEETTAATAEAANVSAQQNEAENDVKVNENGRRRRRKIIDSAEARLKVWRQMCCQPVGDIKNVEMHVSNTQEILELLSLGEQFALQQTHSGNSNCAIASSSSPPPPRVIQLCSVSIDVKRAQIEEVCRAQPGFLRLHISDPLPDSMFLRTGWASFDPDCLFDSETNDDDNSKSDEETKRGSKARIKLEDKALRKICRALNFPQNNHNKSNTEIEAEGERGGRGGGGDDKGDAFPGNLGAKFLSGSAPLIGQRVRPVSLLTNHRPIMLQDLRALARIVRRLDEREGLHHHHCQQQQQEEEEKHETVENENPCLRGLEHLLVDEVDFEECLNFPNAIAMTQQQQQQQQKQDNKINDDDDDDEQEHLEELNGGGDTQMMMRSGRGNTGSRSATTTATTATTPATPAMRRKRANGTIKLQRCDSDQSQSGEGGAAVGLRTALDRLVLYARVVHRFDWYAGGIRYEGEASMPFVCAGLLHCRGEFLPHHSSHAHTHKQQKHSELICQSEVTSHMNETRLRTDQILSELGGGVVPKSWLRNPEEEVEAFITSNCREKGPGKWLCPLSGKKFKGAEFVRKHIHNKYGAQLEALRNQCMFFNAYLEREVATRPQLLEAVHMHLLNSAGAAAAPPSLQPAGRNAHTHTHGHTHAAHRNYHNYQQYGGGGGEGARSNYATQQHNYHNQNNYHGNYQHHRHYQQRGGGGGGGGSGRYLPPRAIRGGRGGGAQQQYKGWNPRNAEPDFDRDRDQQARNQSGAARRASVGSNEDWN